MDRDQRHVARPSGRSWGSRLIGRRATEKSRQNIDPLGKLHEWVLSLPWVVERPARQRPSGPRHFAVNCKPTGCRRIWLTTGPVGDRGDRQELTIAVVLPIELSSTRSLLGGVWRPGNFQPATWS
jgi:hypothetical protein